MIAPGSIGLGSESLYERLRVRVAGTEIATNEGSISLTVSIGAAPGTGQTCRGTPSSPALTQPCIKPRPRAKLRRLCDPLIVNTACHDQR